MNRTSRILLSAVLLVGFVSVLACGSSSSDDFGPTASSLAKGGGGGGKGGGNKPPAGEAAANNISFPVILSDNVAPAAFPVDGMWRFAAIATPETQCVQEGAASLTVDPSILCYYGRHTTTVSETGELTYDGDATLDKKVWWLQQRAANWWKAFTIGYEGTEFAVSAVDVGDLLESSPSIAVRQIRTEFNMLQDVSNDALLSPYLVTDWTLPVPSPCAIPAAANQSLGCFAAVGMSGAVPSTQQSGNEIQGTDFGPGVGVSPGTGALVDPTIIRIATPADGSAAIPVHSIVYSRCLRFVVQKINGNETWDESTGQWAGPAAGTPVVNVAAYTNAYSAEINSGGGLVYGYNWSASTAATGLYRLTWVLDGNDDVGPKCGSLKTKFVSGTTKLVNVGEANAPKILYFGDSQLGDEGGLVYLDLNLTAKGGGSRGGGGTGGEGELVP